MEQILPSDICTVNSDTEIDPHTQEQKSPSPIRIEAPPEKKGGLDHRDLSMMCISVPVVDYWEMREELDRLTDNVERLERVLECFILLYKEERVKTWELILKEMLKEQERKMERRYGNRTR